MADISSSAPASTNTTTSANIPVHPASGAKLPTQGQVSQNKDKTPVSQKEDNDSWDVQEGGKTVKKSRKEIIDAYQLRQLSDKKRSEAEHTLSEYNKVWAAAKGDPVKFMRALGHDFDKLASNYLAQKAEEQMMDPKDRELKAAKAEAEQYKKWVEEQKSAQEKAEKEANISAERSKIHSEIVQAIEEAKDLGMPVDEELVIAIAQKMILQDKKQKPLNAKEALPKAYASTQKWLQGMASKMEGEALVKWLGTDVAMKIRKHDLAQLKAKRAGTAPRQGNSLVKPPTEKSAKQRPYKLMSEWKEELNKKYPSPNPF